MDPRIRSDIDSDSVFTSFGRKKPWYRSIEMPFIWIGGGLVLALILLFLFFPWKSEAPEADKKAGASDLVEISVRLDRLAASVEALRMQGVFSDSLGEDGQHPGTLDTLTTMNSELSQQVSALSAKVDTLQASILELRQMRSVPQASAVSAVRRTGSAVSHAAKPPKKTVSDRQGSGGRSSQEYRVQKGDTLYSIARKNKISVAALMAANRMNDKDPIHPGQRLVIPR